MASKFSLKAKENIKIRAYCLGHSGQRCHMRSIFADRVSDTKCFLAKYVSGSGRGASPAYLDLVSIMFKSTLTEHRLKIIIIKSIINSLSTSILISVYGITRKGKKTKGKKKKPCCPKEQRE